MLRKPWGTFGLLPAQSVWSEIIFINCDWVCSCAWKGNKAALPTFYWQTSEVNSTSNRFSSSCVYLLISETFFRLLSRQVLLELSTTRCQISKSFYIFYFREKWIIEHTQVEKVQWMKISLVGYLITLSKRKDRNIAKHEFKTVGIIGKNRSFQLYGINILRMGLVKCVLLSLKCMI